MNVRRWLHEHSLKLLAIRDTPQAIAGGVAIGVFFGFMPLFGLKTLLAIFFAWLTGTNILAAVLAGTAHDIIFPFMPVIYLWEYDLGYWILNGHWPASVVRHVLTPANWRSWARFVTIGKPMLLGAAVCGAPLAVVAFFATRRVVARHQRKKHQQEAAAPLG
ncbi:MAG: DUF2062 domain-containing protein [Verrucomicrobiota bacterium]|jgi:hypothetical protein